jgi:anthranilate synthase component 1
VFGRPDARDLAPVRTARINPLPSVVLESPTKDRFLSLVRDARRGHPPDTLVVPVCLRLLDDQLTPVLAYRRLVAPDERTAPSFLLESVEGGERLGRHSILGARPAMEVVAFERSVTVTDHRGRRRAGQPGVVTTSTDENPLDVPRRLTAHLTLVNPPELALPKCMLGGWVGFAAYDTVRYVEPEKLGFTGAPRDDRRLPELHFGYYDGVVIFDHVDRLVTVVRLVEVAPGASDGEVGVLYDSAADALERRAKEIQTNSKPLASGRVLGKGLGPPPLPLASNITRDQHAEMVDKAHEYIRAGDVFQVVLGQRFERRSGADPFDVYRALRAVNPSPYMTYLQAHGCILVASSPEILCRVRRSPADPRSLVLTNRPLAGTRRRGTTPQEDAALERELLADPKERAEHTMLVDLGRNDVGSVCVPGTIELPALMQIERYSHVMHISSTVTGRLRPGLDAWDALRATLPAGTISGAPKIRAMQVIDELEPVRRGPYGGGLGYVSLSGDMDIALSLRTMVVPTSMHDVSTGWMYHLQAAGGIVADSEAPAEYMETVNKASALSRAIDLAEQAFAG